MADIMSQEEIEAFLEMVEEDDIQPNRFKDEQVSNQQNKYTYYDFKRPNIVSKQNLRNIRRLLDRFVYNVLPELRSLVKKEVEMQLHSVDVLTFDEFLMCLPHPTFFYELKLDGRTFFVEINPSLIQSFMESCEIQFNNVEKIVSNEIMRKLVNTFIYSEDFERIGDDIEIIDFHFSQPYYRPKKHSTSIMAVFEIIVGSSSGMVNICLPYEEFKDFFKENNKKEKNFDFNLDIEIGKTKKYNVKEIDNFKVGDTLLLNDFAIKINDNIKEIQ